MPRITVLPHPEICPAGTTFEAEPGISLCDSLLAQGIEIEHACEKSRARHLPRDRPRRLLHAVAVDRGRGDLLDWAWG
jgi:2Fe-2S ferredoxin